MIKTTALAYNDREPKMLQPMHIPTLRKRSISSSLGNKPLVVAKNKKKRKKLHFDHIEIIELPLEMGDNPSVQDGPPLTVGWEPQRRIMAGLEHFETIRPPRRGPRRLGKQLRERLLAKQGISRRDIEQATINAKKARLERYWSILAWMRARKAAQANQQQVDAKPASSGPEMPSPEPISRI